MSYPNLKSFAGSVLVPIGLAILLVAAIALAWVFSGWTYLALDVIHGGREPEACTESVVVLRTVSTSRQTTVCGHEDHHVTVSGEYINTSSSTKVHRTTVTCRCAPAATTPDTEEEDRAMWGKR